MNSPLQAAVLRALRCMNAEIAHTWNVNTLMALLAMPGTRAQIQHRTGIESANLRAPLKNLCNVGYARTEGTRRNTLVFQPTETGLAILNALPAAPEPSTLNPEP